MKKFMPVLLGILLLSALPVQGFEPLDSWAYRYEEFVPGKVFNSKGAVILEGVLNISVVDGKLHFVSGDVIMEADMFQVFSATLQEDSYMNVGGRMLRVLSGSETAAVLEAVDVDMDRLSKVDIGYGISSATASTQGLNKAALEGIVQNQANMNYLSATTSRGSGERLPLKITRYLLTRGTLVEARRREVAKLPQLDKKELDAFVKAEKLKWDKVDDLQKIAEYISGQR